VADEVLTTAGQLELTVDRHASQTGGVRAAKLAALPRNPLRVCHVAYTFYENDNRVIRYAEALAERGSDVDVIALRRPGQTRRGHHSGVRVYRVQRRAVTERLAPTYLLKLVWFLIQSTILLSFLQLRKRYDVVHVHNIPDFLVFAAIVPKLMGARVILDIHDILPELYAMKFRAADGSALFRGMLWVERLSCRFADHVIVANHLWQGKLTQRAVPPEKCTTVMNYPDLRLFKPAAKRRKDNRFIILYPGTLNRHQGLDIAVRAFALVKDRMPTAELHIYGEGPERAVIARLACESALGDRLRLMDRVPISEISAVMAAADVGVVPKRASGFGNEAFSTKILEFMACGVPVIVSRTQVDSYYFNDNVVRFFESENEASLAAAFLEVYTHRQSHSAWIERAQAFAVALSWQERVRDYEHVVASLVSVPSGVSPVDRFTAA